MLRVVLLGCGQHSQTHHAAALAHYAAEHPGAVELAGACDLNVALAQQVCRDYGFAQAFTDLEQMLSTVRPDACFAILPVPLIASLSTKLLERGLPCVIEKPPGATLEEARALREAARRSGTPHQVSVNRRFIPALNRAREFCLAHGPLRHIEGSMLRHARKEPDFVWGTGVHLIDALRHLGGDVAEFRSDPRRGSEMSSTWFQIDLDFASGCQGVARILPTCGLFRETYEMASEGAFARVTIDLTFAAHLQLWEENNLVVDLQEMDQPFDQRVGAYDETVCFLSALAAGRTPRPSVADVLPSLELCLAAYEQAQQSGAVR